MEHLINIDNGGTLTDICVWDGSSFSFTKTLTTPYDLSECLFDGISKASKALYGETDLERLLHHTAHIRYSTTQGTNALVERKGPAIGLIVEEPGVVDEMRSGPDSARALFDDLVGTRVESVDTSLEADALERSLVQKVNALTTNGAARIVVIADTPEAEAAIRTVLLRAFPRHLLGSVPFLYSWEFVPDRLRTRRGWSSVINTFLHPVMEGFLFQAQARLREHKVSNPLLVYRNDGASSRVAKSVALKTYSSGPRGGLEGTRALAESYGLEHVLMMDVGGTTTDVGVVEDGVIRTTRRGVVEGAPTSFPMSDVHSSGVGGSSIIAVRDGAITVGPRSVGAAPGPACFGLGGKEATITDVNLLLGVLDPASYLGGQMSLDAARSEAVIRSTIAEPLGISLEEALVQMEQAYYATMAGAVGHLAEDRTTLAAFGGAGPMSACGAAELAGVKTVLVPRMAAVFSAFGISFSDIGKTYEAAVEDRSAPALASLADQLAARAGRDMFQEGYALEGCTLHWTLVGEDARGEAIEDAAYARGEASAVSGEQLSLRLEVSANLPHSPLADGSAAVRQTATSAGSRLVRMSDTQRAELPVYVLDDQRHGAHAVGPAIVEGPFFTARVSGGWELDVTSNGDLILTDPR
ncbi:hydantoinase/oxoprolinase family protein [Sinomonas sp. P10A9]|uniref:Hydantoinase/oxoprolinase family protein n=1 Tax=Sinomonas puerhi TaxID=3238584 RepID=A0AB39L2R1_9MICC